jgi:biopolymer transport protein ExbD
MGMDVGGASQGPTAEINITPLVDIVLVLLIIFMVITPLLTKTLPVLVPEKSETDEPTPEMQRQIVVHLNQNNTLTVNKQPVRIEDLEEKLVLGLKILPEKVIFFEADDAAAYGNAVLVMDIIKGSGARAIGIMTPDE